MFILGGICFIYLGLINEVLPWSMPLWQQILIGAVGITILEFLTGCIVNLWLGWDVWDYSGMPSNILGQICPQYMLLWLWHWPGSFWTTGSGIGNSGRNDRITD